MKGEYYHTKESVDEYIRLAKGFNGKSLIDKFSEFLEFGKKILEIGSGPGKDFNLLSENYSVIGSDYSIEFIKRLEANNPDKKFLQLDAKTLKTDVLFDAIYSNKVLHHLSDNDLKNSVLNQSRLLNKQGLICHSFWRGENSEYFKGMLVNYQTKDTLRKLFESEFEILLLESYAEFEDLDSLLIIARKKN